MKGNYLSSGVFAELCGTSKETLRHYKNIGLLQPRHIGANGYQYYEAEQFYEYYAINMMKMTGTPLANIKDYMEKQRVSSIFTLMEEQQKELLKKKDEIEKMQFVVNNSIENMKIGLSSENPALTPKIAFFKEEHLLVVPYYEFISSINEETNEDLVLIAVLQKFKEICETHQMHTDFQLGAISALHSHQITDLYVKVNKQYDSRYCRTKPAGKYLYVIQKGSWDSKNAYRVLFEYIEKHHIQTTGDIYAYDLAGFMVNGVEENSMTIVSIQVE